MEIFMFNRQELKKEAKALLGQIFKSLDFLLIMVSYWLVSVAYGCYYLQFFIYFTLKDGLLMGLLAVILILLTIGLQIVLYDIVRGSIPIATKDGWLDAIIRIWERKHSLRFLTSEFWQIVFVCLWALIPLIGWVIAVVKVYSYCQGVYVVAASKETITGYDSLEVSKALMNGYKLDYFVLELSFFFWYLLSLVTFGVALIYVIPYISITKALYFMELKRVHPSITIEK